MKIQFLQANALNNTLLDLIDKHEEFHWAVAWGSLTGAAKQLLKHPTNFKNVTFGVNFSHTDPDLIDELVGIKGARAATKFKGGTYHPKVYCFRTGIKAAAIVGSANFTFGGLDKNLEASIFIEGDAGHPFFTDLFSFTKESAKLGEPITTKFAANYRIKHKRASRMPKPDHDPMDSLPKTRPTALTSPLVLMNWTDYAKKVRSKKNHHNVDNSLKLLRVAQEWLASVSSFSELSLGHRQAISGLVVNEAQRSEPGLGQNWGWFGSMKGMGNFVKLINANNTHLARAIDSLPNKGEVSKEHFDTFVKHFRRAFKYSDRTGSYATASRLLAMKRPDTFVCVCSPNITQASERMDFARTTLILDDYWDKVVEVVRLSEWYNVSKPDDDGGELWEFRAAMLDVILYR